MSKWKLQTKYGYPLWATFRLFPRRHMFTIPTLPAMDKQLELTEHDSEGVIHSWWAQVAFTSVDYKFLFTRIVRRFEKFSTLLIFTVPPGRNSAPS